MSHFHVSSPTSSVLSFSLAGATILVQNGPAVSVKSDASTLQKPPAPSSGREKSFFQLFNHCKFHCLTTIFDHYLTTYNQLWSAHHYLTIFDHYLTITSPVIAKQLFPNHSNHFRTNISSSAICSGGKDTVKVHGARQCGGWHLGTLVCQYPEFIIATLVSNKRQKKHFFGWVSPA